MRIIEGTARNMGITILINLVNLQYKKKIKNMAKLSKRVTNKSN